MVREGRDPVGLKHSVDGGEPKVQLGCKENVQTEVGGGMYDGCGMVSAAMLPQLTSSSMMISISQRRSEQQRKSCNGEEMDAVTFTNRAARKSAARTIFEHEDK
jgi:hypothetical protein